MYCYTSSDIVKVLFSSTIFCYAPKIRIFFPSLWYSILLSTLCICISMIYLIPGFIFLVCNDFRSSINMTKNQTSTLSNGEVLKRRLGHHTLVILAMNDFLVLRSTLYFLFMFFHFKHHLLSQLPNHVQIWINHNSKDSFSWELGILS